MTVVFSKLNSVSALTTRSILHSYLVHSTKYLCVCPYSSRYVRLPIYFFVLVRGFRFILMRAILVLPMMTFRFRFCKIPLWFAEMFPVLDQSQQMLVLLGYVSYVWKWPVLINNRIVRKRFHLTNYDFLELAFNQCFVISTFYKLTFKHFYTGFKFRLCGTNSFDMKHQVVSYFY